MVSWGDGLQLVCSPFFVVLLPRWCQVWSIAPCHLCALPGASMVSGVGVLPPCHLCARPAASMVSGMEHCPVPPLRPPWCLDGVRCGSIATVPPLRPSCRLTSSHYTRYTISQTLGILQPCPLPTALYGSYRASQILGNCK